MINSNNSIRVHGARTHNLKNIHLDLPRQQLIVFTGLSGSGKSSLAFDTLYAEGQRRYVESLSAYARQFLQLMEKPDVDWIEGLSPAIAIQQKATSHNPRSTVGTVTEIHDYLRLLFARVGEAYCPQHQQALTSQTVAQMVDHVLALPTDSRMMIFAPLVSARKGEYVELLTQLQAQGFARIRLDGELYELGSVPPLDKHKKHSIELLIDRLKIRVEHRQRLAESFEVALRYANGRAIVQLMDSGVEHHFSSKFACPHCDYSLAALEPRLFSFNSPQGACPRCDGLGQLSVFDPLRVVANRDLSLAYGAIKGWDKRNSFYFQMLCDLAKHYQFDIEMPFKELPKNVQQVLLYGSGTQRIAFTYGNAQGGDQQRLSTFEGIIPNFERRYRDTDSSLVREELANYISLQTCPLCQGARLRVEACHVKIAGYNLPQLSMQTLRENLDFFQKLQFSGNRLAIAEKIVKEIRDRLGFLVGVGLDYLSLARSAETLSGGEAQRIRLASQIGSGLTGVMYVLDEPSIGLHQRDNDRLLSTLRRLRDLGNTVIVVEHDEDAIRAADCIVDIGPGAGEHGGHILAVGSLETIMQTATSITGQFLSGKRRITLPPTRRVPDQQRYLTLRGACGNNLKNVDLNIPLGLLVCITGVSGSGKSTLINDTLYGALHRHFYAASNVVAAQFDSLCGHEALDKVINVDQSPIGRTPRSNPATYSGVFTAIRELFAGVPMARERGYGPGRFSFNVKGGRCEACQGDGVIKVEMHFLPDVYVTCEVCDGKRYNRQTLEILYKQHSIDQILAMTVEQALLFFAAVPSIAKKLQTLVDVGLAYIRLGQSATTLSGGEAQRVKLALELSKRDTGRTLYILDEPTTGLHFHDIDLLMRVLYRLRDHGNTIVIIEHNLDVIKTADWIIDLGPEGGNEGGRIIAVGSPEQIAVHPDSYTGKYLQRVLNPSASVEAS